MVWSGLEVVSITAETEECTINEKGTECAFDNITSLTMLPAGQKVELALRSDHMVPLGTLHLIPIELDLVCQKESIAWLRSYTTNIKSVWRCPRAGSCSDEICAKLDPRKSIPELEEEYPGNNFCRESASGFILDGCGLPGKTCVFYRISIVPLSAIAFELFKCPSWEFRLKLKLELQIGSEKMEEEIVVSPGLTHHWKAANLSLTFSPQGIPPLPILGENFLTNRKHTALAPTIPIHLECRNRWAAEMFECALNQKICHSCNTHFSTGNVRCHCEDNDLEKIVLDETRSLPLSTGEIAIREDRGKLLVSTPYVPINMVVKMQKTRLAVEHLETKCTVNPGILMGCYSCLTGGRFNFSCSSIVGEVFASITCIDGTNWVTRCTPKGVSSSVVLSWDHPEIGTKCEVDCLGEKTSFPLEGILIYLPRNFESGVEVGGAFSNQTFSGGVNITMPHLKFVLFQSLGSGIQIFTAILAVVISVGVCIVCVRFNPAWMYSTVLAWITQRATSEPQPKREPKRIYVPSSTEHHTIE
jgi:hypothetical protein